MSDRAAGGLSTPVAVLFAVVLGIVAFLIIGYLVILALLHIATAPRDGEAIARTAVDRMLTELVESLGQVRAAIDAESLAADHFATASTGDTVVTPFAWSGAVAADDVAIVDVAADR